MCVSVCVCICICVHACVSVRARVRVCVWRSSKEAFQGGRAYGRESLEHELAEVEDEPRDGQQLEEQVHICNGQTKEKGEGQGGGLGGC